MSTSVACNSNGLCSPETKPPRDEEVVAQAVQLEVQPDDPQQGEPIELLGSRLLICARRHRAPLACVGDVNLALKPPPHPRRDEIVSSSGSFNTSADSPMALVGLDAVELAVDREALCFRRSDGNVFCWKNSVFSKPQVPTLEDWASPSTAFSMQYQRCSILKSAGLRCEETVYCMDGRKSTGVPVPQDALATVKDPVDVSNGERLGCALEKSGSVQCWGYVAGPDTCSNGIPMRIAGIDDAIAVEIGKRSACALRSSGGVACWGDNGRGMLARPEKELAFSSKAVDIPNVGHAVALEVEDDGAIVLKANGEVWIWGFSLAHDLEGDPSTPRRIEEIENAIDIVFANGYGCALLADHNLRCFGPQIRRRYTDGKRPPFEDKKAWIEAEERELEPGPLTQQ